jgi:hypothetical protein
MSHSPKHFSVIKSYLIRIGYIGKIAPVVSLENRREFADLIMPYTSSGVTLIDKG